MAVSQRYKILIRWFGKSDAAFAKEIGISRSSISSLLKGNTKPSIDTLASTLQRFPEINAEWLVLGTEPMLKEENKTEPGKLEEPMPIYTKNLIDTLEKQLAKKDEQIEKSSEQTNKLLELLNKKIREQEKKQKNNRDDSSE